MKPMPGRLTEVASGCARPHHMRKAIITLVTMTLLAACGDGDPTEPPPPATVASVVISPTTQLLNSIDATVQFNATPRDAQGNSISGKTITWSSTQSGVATISLSGLATAAGNGETTITAAVDGINGTTTLTVTQQAAALSITAQPQGAATGAPLVAQPVVAVVDANGHTVVNDNATAITATIATGGGSLMGTTTATAQAGVATFADLGIDGLVGNRTLRFTAGTLPAAVSSAFAIVAGTAATLSIETHPAGAAAGIAFTTQPVIRVLDASGNIVASDNSTVITASIASGGGTLVGESAVTVQGGIATFTDLGIDGLVGDRTLAFNTAQLPIVTSNLFGLVPGPAASLSIQTQPAGASSGLSLTTQPVVTILDGSGNIATGDNATVVTATIASGSGTLTGNAGVTVQGGVATFTDLGIDGLVGQRTLSFAAPQLPAVVSSAFGIVAGPPASLSIVTQPAGAEAGEAFTTQPVVNLVDAGGNVTNDNATVITASIASGGGTLVGNTDITVQGGVATFTDLAIDGFVADRTLSFAAGQLPTAVSDVFGLAAGPAATLSIVTQPAGSAAGIAFTTQPIVRVLDASTNIVTSDNSTVIIASIASGGGTLTGDVDVTVQAGIATFTDLGIAGLVGDRTLSFGAAPLPAVVSETFGLVAGASAALSVVTQPTGAAAGIAFTTQPAITILDGSGNVVTNDNATVVTASIASGGGSTMGTTTATAVSGVATFIDLAVGGSVGDRTLTFASGAMTAVTSAAITLAAGPAAELALDGGNNQTALADTDLPDPLAVIVRDAFDNAIADAPVTWTVSQGGGAPSESNAPTDAQGISSVTYHLGPDAGAEAIEAAIAGLVGSPVVFAATATPNARITGTITLTNQLMVVAVKDVTAIGPTFARPPRSGTAPRSIRSLNGSNADVATPVLPRMNAEPEYVPGELIVTYRAAALGAPVAGASAYRSPATAQATATTMRAALDSHVRAGRLSVRGVSPAILAARVSVDDPNQLAAVEQSLRADPAVARVERHAIARSFAMNEPPLRHRDAAAITPGDPLFPFQAWHYRMIDLPRAWDITTGSSMVLVAVIDDGIRFDHPDIAANLTSDGYDFVSNTMSVPVCAGGSMNSAGDGDGYDPDPTHPGAVIMDPDLECISGLQTAGGHGLHVAGTIGATANDGVGGVGINWNVAIRPVRALGINGSGSVYDIAQGVLYAAGLPADDGAGGTVSAPSVARIINMSLGGPGSTTIMEDAVAAATAAGSLIIAAAGNDGNSVPFYPAAYPEVISVSAVAPDRSLASYSSFGSTVDIAAPGGEQSLGCDFAVISTTWNFVTSQPNHDCKQGTSMAAPHVAGVAALVLSNQPGLSVSELRSRLLDYAVNAGPADQFGAGIVNARNSLTQSFSPPANLYARLVDAGSGATVATVPAIGGSYSFNGLDNGDYVVFAGQDENGDGSIGVPVRRWGAAGGTATPLATTVVGAGEYPVSFQIGLPIEIEPNNDLNSADFIASDGYVLGTITDPVNELDVFLFRAPSPGSYVFETSGVDGACGFTYEVNTLLGLYDSSGTLITSSDDIDAASNNYCSRITMTLASGTYYIGVFGSRGGQYAVSARTGL